MSTLEEKRINRWKMLKKYYDVTDGDGRFAIVNMWEIGDELGFDRDTTMATFNYLHGEGLLEPVTLGGGSTITHYGVLEVEQAEGEPSQPTDHFPPGIINIVTNSPGTQIVHGNKNVVTSTTSISNKTLATELEKRFKEVDLNLPESAELLVKAVSQNEPDRIQIMKVAQELAASDPKWKAVLKDFLKNFAVNMASSIVLKAIELAIM